MVGFQVCEVEQVPAAYAVRENLSSGRWAVTIRSVPVEGGSAKSSVNFRSLSVNTKLEESAVAGEK